MRLLNPRAQTTPGFVRCILWQMVWLACPVTCLAGAPLASSQIIVPPEPRVRPSLPDLARIDRNLDKLDDLLEGRVASLEKAMASPGRPQPADEAVALEFVFSARVGQTHLDQFIKSGGQITHIYRSVSYGWNGILPLSRVRQAVRQAGPTLVGVVQSRLVQVQLDRATTTGHVRPYVWNLGYDGSSDVTIAIMDTGVDDSHTDLAGRMEYWHDYSTDASPTPVSILAHGTHVAGIALGTGEASGANPTVIHWTDQGMFPSSNNYFYPAIHSFSESVTQFDWTSSMAWNNSAGGSAQHTQDTVGASDYGYYYLFSPIVKSSSPITATTTGFPNPYLGYLRLYTTYNSSYSGAVGREYATTNTVTATVGNFGVGDTYNLFRGVAPGCRWAGAKVFPNDGQGAESTDINAAVDDLVSLRIAHNIKIINMSFCLSEAGAVDPTERAKANTAVDNGIVVCVAAGNNGPGGEISDPGRAARVITAGSISDNRQLTDYTSVWKDVPDSTEDYKPDLLAPGGSVSAACSQIMSVDSNDADSVFDSATGFADRVANDYTLMNGTSMASPFVAGAAALVIDAWQVSGHAWDFNSSTDPLFVKMLLCASATETNTYREGNSYSPTNEKGSINPITGMNKDVYEGYGMINVDAAVDALTRPLVPVFTSSLGSRRSAGFFVDLAAGLEVSLTLAGLTTQDYDLYLYDSRPDVKGNPVILASSTRAGSLDESIGYVPAESRRAYVLVKACSGSGAFVLTSVICSADHDGDGDVDMEDFGWFQLCLSGPANPPTTGCHCADLDHDDDVDGLDIDAFRACLSGPGTVAADGCVPRPM